MYFFFEIGSESFKENKNVKMKYRKKYFNIGVKKKIDGKNILSVIMIIKKGKKINL
jgi:hypothetical protein